MSNWIRNFQVHRRLIFARSSLLEVTNKILFNHLSHGVLFVELVGDRPFTAHRRWNCDQIPDKQSHRAGCLAGAYGKLSSIFRCDFGLHSAACG